MSSVFTLLFLSLSLVLDIKNLIPFYYFEEKMHDSSKKSKTASFDFFFNPLFDAKLLLGKQMYMEVNLIALHSNFNKKCGKFDIQATFIHLGHIDYICL